MLGGGFVCRLLSPFLLVFCVLRLLLFCGWGGFFRGWGVLFGGWLGVGVPCFFVSLSRGRFCLFGSCPVPLGCCRGSCVRVVARFRLVRAGGVACPRVRGAFPLGSGRRRLPSLRFLALRASWLFVVGGLVCGGCLRCLAGGVGRLRRCPGSWRSVVAFLAPPRLGSPLGGVVFVSFF